MQAYLQRLYPRLMRFSCEIGFKNFSNHSERIESIGILGLERRIRVGLQFAERQTCRDHESDVETITRNGPGGHNRSIGQTTRWSSHHHWSLENGRSQDLDADWRQSRNCQMYCHQRRPQKRQSRNILDSRRQLTGKNEVIQIIRNKLLEYNYA